jgi:hypothetical protein
MPLAQAHRVTEIFRQELLDHVPALADAKIRLVPEASRSMSYAAHNHRH